MPPHPTFFLPELRTYIRAACLKVLYFPRLLATLCSPPLPFSLVLRKFSFVDFSPFHSFFSPPPQFSRKRGVLVWGDFFHLFPTNWTPFSHRKLIWSCSFSCHSSPFRPLPYPLMRGRNFPRSGHARLSGIFFITLQGPHVVKKRPFA